MDKNNLSNKILRNPQYLDLKDSGDFDRQKTLPFIPKLIISIVTIIFLSLLYSISVGFIIGGFNYVFKNILIIELVTSKTYIYNLIIGITGLGLMISSIYLNIFFIRFIKR